MHPSVGKRMIIRRKRFEKYTTIGNELLRDERMALDEIGLMCFFLSQPDNWEVRRPALMRRFRGRDGKNLGRESLRRILRNLMRFGWIVARITRLGNGTFSVIYEVKDEAGPELSEQEVRGLLTAHPSDLSGDDESEDVENHVDNSAQPTENESEITSPPTGQPTTVSRLRQTRPGSSIDSLNTESINPNPTKARGAFANVQTKWPADHVLSLAACETMHARLNDEDAAAACCGAPLYLADCAKQTRKICDLATFYRERRWEKFTKEIGPARACFAIHSPQWYRWREYRVGAGQPVAFMDYHARSNPKGTWTEPTEWPPALPHKATA